MPIYNLKLNAGQTLPQQIAGSYLQYVEGNGPIEVRKNGRDWSTYWVGVGTGRGDFNRFEVRNPNAFPVTLSVWADFEEFIDRRRNQIEAPTEFAPVASGGVYVGGILAAASSLNLSGDPAAGRIRRKAVQVANLDPAVNLLLQDSAGVTGLVVRPGETLTQPISGFVRIRNDALAPIACAISEIWWLP